MGCTSLKTIAFPDLKDFQNMTNKLYQHDSLIWIGLSKVILKA